MPDDYSAEQFGYDVGTPFRAVGGFVRGLIGAGGPEFAPGSIGDKKRAEELKMKYADDLGAYNDFMQAGKPLDAMNALQTLRDKMIQQGDGGELERLRPKRMQAAYARLQQIDPKTAEGQAEIQKMGLGGDFGAPTNPVAAAVGLSQQTYHQAAAETEKARAGQISGLAPFQQDTEKARAAALRAQGGLYGAEAGEATKRGEYIEGKGYRELMQLPGDLRQQSAKTYATLHPVAGGAASHYSDPGWLRAEAYKQASLDPLWKKSTTTPEMRDALVEKKLAFLMGRQPAVGVKSGASSTADYTQPVSGGGSSTAPPTIAGVNLGGESPAPTPPPPTPLPPPPPEDALPPATPPLAPMPELQQSVAPPDFTSAQMASAAPPPIQQPQQGQQQQAPPPTIQGPAPIIQPPPTPQLPGPPQAAELPPARGPRRIEVVTPDEWQFLLQNHTPEELAAAGFQPQAPEQQANLPY